MKITAQVKRLAIVGATTVGAVVAFASPASATLIPLTGTLNTSGTLVQYSTYRPHVSGPSEMAISNNTGCADNRFSRFGLRVNDTSQYTNTNQYNGETGSQPFTRASNGSSTIGTGSYAINGRMANETGHGCDNSWAGTILL